MKLRFFLVFAVFALIFGGLSTRLYTLQIHGNANIFGRTAGSNENILPTISARGQIFFTDRSGGEVAVAIVKDYPSLFVSPRDIIDPGAGASLIAPIVGMDATELAEQIEKKKSEGREYLLLTPRAEKAQVEAVETLKLKGLSIEERQGRYYPYRQLASHVVGFVNKSGESRAPEGLYGIEKYYNDALSGGEDKHLTIDRAIQNHAEGLLEDLLKNYGATEGTIIVQNPTSGAILAMATKPDFDPNEYNNFPIKNFINPAVQLIYEPGSVIKPITLAAGIDTGALTPETTYVDTGSVTLNGKTVRNFENKIYGKITMREMIQSSVNTGAIHAERILGHERFYRALQDFGFNEKTGIDLPGEVNNNIRNLVRKDVRAIDFATAAYGQGISVTPISLVTAYSAIANGGILMRPYITEEMGFETVRRVLKESTTEIIRGILALAVVKNRVATIPNYHIAGKTGTAFIADPKSGKYTDQMIHTFVGFAPATNPQFTILVKMERPARGEAAGLTVVSTFKKLAEFILSYYRIAPDNVPILSS